MSGELDREQELRRLRAEAYGRDSDDARRAVAAARLAQLQGEQQGEQSAEGAPEIAPDANGSAEQAPARRSRRIRGPLIAGAAVIVAAVAVAIAVSLSLTPTHPAFVWHNTTAQPAPTASDTPTPVPGSAFGPDSPGVASSPAVAAFLTHPVTPPAAIEQAWGDPNSSAYAGFANSIAAGDHFITVRFQALGTASGAEFWGAFAIDGNGDGVICLVTQDMLGQAPCDTLDGFVESQLVFSTSPRWAWQLVTWEPEGDFGLTPLTGVSQALASTPAFQALNNDAPDLYTAQKALTPVGTRLQNALDNPTPIFGEVKSADGKVFGLVTDPELATVCVSALDSVKPTCGDSTSIAKNGMIVATPEGQYRWVPDGTIAPVPK